MFERKRHDRFSGDDELNLTKYSEKYILPTDGGQPASDFYTPMPQSEPAPQSAVSASASAIPVATAQSDSGERPMVFAVKSHRNMYVYEYSDRLEYYLRTENGMFLYNREAKNR
ncbi:MAG: hypothetical protein NC184_06305 [Roseburia sp.]|nr:hypothetical protein [Roseburia sp.]